MIRLKGKRLKVEQTGQIREIARVFTELDSYDQAQVLIEIERVASAEWAVLPINQWFSVAESLANSSDGIAARSMLLNMFHGKNPASYTETI